MNPVTHFEIPFDDEEKAKEFYSKVFGWKIEPIKEMPYWMVYTTEVDEKFMAKEPNRINGGMYKRGEEGAQSPVIVIEVPDCEAHVKKVEEAGGSVVFSVRKVGDMGIYAQVKDTEGNIIGLWQTLKKE